MHNLFNNLYSFSLLLYVCLLPSVTSLSLPNMPLILFADISLCFNILNH